MGEYIVIAYSNRQACRKAYTANYRRARKYAAEYRDNPDYDDIIIIGERVSSIDKYIIDRWYRVGGHGFRLVRTP